METGIQYYVCAGTDGVFDVLTNARVADVLICQGNSRQPNLTTHSSRTLFQFGTTLTFSMPNTTPQATTRRLMIEAIQIPRCFARQSGHGGSTLLLLLCRS